MGKVIVDTAENKSRSQIVIKNILESVLIKGFSISITLYLIPLTVRLLDKEKYGIWLTIFSIVSWFNMMDVGLGNGFRNKFAHAIALDDKTAAKAIVQTFYAVTLLISISIFVIFVGINPFLDWFKILNVSKGFDENINFIVFITIGLFCIQVYLKNITTVLLSLQKTSLSNFLFLLGNIFSLAGIIILNEFHRVNLLSIALVYMIVPNLVFLTTTFILFFNSLKTYTPIPLKIHKFYLRSLAGLGIKFFFIQITTIVMFSVDNILITQLYGPAQVTPYNISYRLFATAYAGFSIIMAPFWSAFTEAGTKNDKQWIIRSIKNLIKTWFIFSLGLIFLLFFSKFIFNIWVGSLVVIPFSLSVQFCVFTILLSWTGIFAYYLNGVGKIKLQLYISIFQCICNIPLAIFFAKYLGLGSLGIVMATNINLFIAAVILPLQVFKILKEKSNGIWSK